MPSQIPTRKLGRHGPQVSALGLGLMGLSAYYGEIESDEKRFELLDRAYELGQTFWDTADVYSDSEDLIRTWFKRTGKRDEIFLASKFSLNEKWEPDSSPEYVRTACEKSLARLGVESIDLYYCHRVDLRTPIEETVRALRELKQEGKIKYIGLCEVSADTLRRASKIAHIDAVQVEYSPFSLDIENPQIALLETCRELGTATVAYSPLGRGFLTGNYKTLDDFGAGDLRVYMPRFSPENFPRNLQLVDELVDIATRKGCTPSQLTLAWLLAQGEDIIPIPGTKRIKYLEENLGSFEVVLTTDEEQEIRRAVNKAKIFGDRYGDVSLLYADTPPIDKA